MRCAGAPDGSIRLFCKGSDSKVLSMLRGKAGGAKAAGDISAATHENLHVFATHVRPPLASSDLLRQVNLTVK